MSRREGAAGEAAPFLIPERSRGGGRRALRGGNSRPTAGAGGGEAADRRREFYDAEGDVCDIRRVYGGRARGPKSSAISRAVRRHRRIARMPRARRSVATATHRARAYTSQISRRSQKGRPGVSHLIALYAACDIQLAYGGRAHVPKARAISRAVRRHMGRRQGAQPSIGRYRVASHAYASRISRHPQKGRPGVAHRIAPFAARASPYSATIRSGRQIGGPNIQPRGRAVLADQ